MKFKKLEGYENRFAIRLNKGFRLEFEIDFEDTFRKESVTQLVYFSRPILMNRFSYF
jgi:hypothetical protein